MYQTNSKRIFGIDLGLANCGWAFLGRNKSGKFIILGAGCITTESTEPEGNLTHLPEIANLLGLICEI